MSGYTGLAISLGAAALAAKLGLTRYRGPVQKDEHTCISVPSLTMGDVIRDSCGPWNSASRKKVVAASKGLLGRGICRDVVIHPTDWLPSSEPRSDQAFHVYVGTTGQRSPQYSMITPGLVAGIQCPTPLPARPPVWNGYIIKDDLGFPVAEYTTNNLRLLVDADPTLSENAHNLYVRILGLAVDAISSTNTLTLGERPSPTFLTEREADAILGTPNSAANLWKIQQQYTNSQREVRTLEQQLAAANSELEALNAENRVHLTVTENRQGKMTGLSEKILRVPGVKTVELSPEALTIHTDRLRAQDPSNPAVRYDLGEFELTIYLDGSNGGIRAKNVTRSVQGLDGEPWGAPHIDGSGRMILEDNGEALLRLLADGEIVKLSKFVIKNITNPPATPIAMANLKLFPLAK